jgi:hypothetical protein
MAILLERPLSEWQPRADTTGVYTYDYETM